MISDIIELTAAGVLVVLIAALATYSLIVWRTS